MNILLLGYGKMGKAIEEIALHRGHHITGRINLDNQHDLNDHIWEKTDVVIEFSSPEAAFENIKLCIQKKKPVVCGTTGWLDKKKDLEGYVSEHHGAFFYASNFSIGVNIFFRLNRHLAKMMEHYPDYDVTLKEIHHTAKKDSPSGTAITLAEGIVGELSRKDSWAENTDDGHKINIIAERLGDVPGTHVVKYENEIDHIEIKHEAKSRKGFASGAVLVAEWIINKKGVLSMDDFLKF